MKPFITWLLCCCALGLAAQDPSAPIIFIYDASGSMWGQLQGKTKMEIGREVLSASVNELPDKQEIGLLAYGHRQKGDCQDVEFLVPVTNQSKEKINQSLSKIKPLGKTPLAYSALQAINYLRKTNSKATIILITDGIESCGGNICEVVRAAREEGIDFKLHIIGFGLKDDETEQLRCAALAGDGQYYGAADAGSLGTVLNQATVATVDQPNSNVTVFAVKNGNPVDVLVKAYKSGDSRPFTSARSYSDTADLYLPPGNYQLQINPLGGSDVAAVVVNDLQSYEDQVVHRDVSFDSGKLAVSVTNNGEGWDAVVAIYPSGTQKAAARGRTYGKSDEYDLNPGTYDVEVKALRIKGEAIEYLIEGVNIEANKTQQANHDFKSGIARIGASSAQGLVDAVVKIVNTTTGKTSSSGRTYTSPGSNPKEYILNPGSYEVTLTGLGDHKGKKQSFTMVIEAGQTSEKITNF